MLALVHEQRGQAILGNLLPLVDLGGVDFILARNLRNGLAALKGGDSDVSLLAGGKCFTHRR